MVQHFINIFFIATVGEDGKPIIIMPRCQGYSSIYERRMFLQLYILFDYGESGKKDRLETKQTHQRACELRNLLFLVIVYGKKAMKRGVVGSSKLFVFHFSDRQIMT